MLFNSLEFLIFFPLVALAYFAIPHRWRWLLLLGASYYFYMCWKAEYLFLILASTIIDYLAAIGIHRAKSAAARRLCLLASLGTNLGLLFAFKYFNFFNAQARGLFDSLNIFYDVPAFNVLLPVGISFYTFQTLSYTIDVYRGAKKPERHLGIFALYVAFFPQLVAGPIERSTCLLPQLRLKQTFDPDRVVEGLRLALWGMFKKVVIADRLAIYVDAVYGAPGAHCGAAPALATYFFAFQIYCDFSGYSDIAIGCARILGINLMPNFNRPYFARSIREFWQRWHISLSTWFRDYLYIPLGGSRVGKSRWHANILLVFVISGLWHGANWTFLLWGALHGFYLLFGAWTGPRRERLAQSAGLSRRPGLHNALRVLATFHLALLGWVFFRANSIGEAWTILRNACALTRPGALQINILGDWGDLALSLAVIAILELVHLAQRDRPFEQWLGRAPRAIRWAAYLALSLAIMNLGVVDEIPFIYFQF
jgi:alginate O-acetyltransferase complex protein AlgI